MNIWRTEKQPCSLQQTKKTSTVNRIVRVCGHPNAEERSTSGHRSKEGFLVGLRYENILALAGLDIMEECLGGDWESYLQCLLQQIQFTALAGNKRSLWTMQGIAQA